MTYTLPNTNIVVNAVTNVVSPNGYFVITRGTHVITNTFNLLDIATTNTVIGYLGGYVTTNTFALTNLALNSQLSTLNSSKAGTNSTAAGTYSNAVIAVGAGGVFGSITTGATPLFDASLFYLASNPSNYITSAAGGITNGQQNINVGWTNSNITLGRFTVRLTNALAMNAVGSVYQNTSSGADPFTFQGQALTLYNNVAATNATGLYIGQSTQIYHTNMPSGNVSNEYTSIYSEMVIDDAGRLWPGDHWFFGPTNRQANMVAGFQMGGTLYLTNAVVNGDSVARIVSIPGGGGGNGKSRRLGLTTTRFSVGLGFSGYSGTSGSIVGEPYQTAIDIGLNYDPYNNLGVRMGNGIRIHNHYGDGLVIDSPYSGATGLAVKVTGTIQTDRLMVTNAGTGVLVITNPANVAITRLGATATVTNPSLTIVDGVVTVASSLAEPAGGGGSSSTNFITGTSVLTGSTTRVSYGVTFTARPKILHSWFEPALGEVATLNLITNTTTDLVIEARNGAGVMTNGLQFNWGAFATTAADVGVFALNTVFAGSTTTGLVTSAGGDAGKFYKADGTWATPSGSVTFNGLNEAFKGSDLVPFSVSNFWGSIQVVSNIAGAYGVGSGGFGTWYTNTPTTGKLLVEFSRNSARSSIDTNGFFDLSYLVTHTSVSCNCIIYGQQVNAFGALTNSVVAWTNAAASPITGAAYVWTNYPVSVAATLNTNAFNDFLVELTCTGQAPHPNTNAAIAVRLGKSGWK